MPTPRSAPASSDASHAFDDWCSRRFEALAHDSRATRAASAADAGFNIEDFRRADLLAVTFSDGSTLYTDPVAFLAEHGEADRTSVDDAAAASRAAHPAAGHDTAPASAGGARRVVLPFAFRAAGATTRAGGGATAEVERYTLSKLTPPTTLDRVYDAGAKLSDLLDRALGIEAPQAAAQALARGLCRSFETATLHPALGEADGLLLRWDGKAWSPLKDALRAAPGSRVVLFLHGTASSHEGSFGPLWAADRYQRLPDDFAQLARQHELLAWEHRSLTVSPLANAAALLDALRANLPAGALVDLVSHSRGGLVGELLALALRADAPGADDAANATLAVAERARWRAVFDAAYGDDHADTPAMRAFFAAAEHELPARLGSFVRVACPARGTLLADRRTDLFLSLLLHSARLAFGTALPLWDRLQALVQGLVAARAEASALPGLEAMIPGSALTLALNDDSAPPRAGRLRVVAGDTRDLGWGGILTFLGNVFYGLHDHDFVVHTHSMFGGLKRADAKSLRVEDRSVTHFGYFKPDALTRAPLFTALAGRDDGFSPIAEDEARTRGLLQALGPGTLSRKPRAQWLAELARPEQAKKPILVVLPGIMGSELGDAEEPTIWLTLGAMLRGELARLNVDHPQRLVPTGLTPVAYERLLAAAAKQFALVPFAYDWRAPIEESAAALRELLSALQAQAAQRGQPLHLIAHSMGGLVARTALLHPDADPMLWTSMRQRGSRLLMLGTPNRGSYAPVQLLAQQHSLSQLLAGMSRHISAESLAGWGGHFVGLMQMLPADPDPTYRDLYDAATWAALQAADATVRPPAADALQRALTLRHWLEASWAALQADDHVLYVAGAGSTPVALVSPDVRADTITEGGLTTPPGLGFDFAWRGDGTVPWTSTLAPERTWYAECEHGDLADHVDAFNAYFDLLRTGATSELAKSPPRESGWLRGRVEGAGAGAPPRPRHLPSLPDDPTAFVLGMRSVPPRRQPRIALQIVHGSLDFARHPLLVGHYQNDRILGAARRVDEKLDGQLTRMVEMKLFAGASLTGCYLRPPCADGQEPPYPGAVVVGLGTVGELTPTLLADTVTRGVLRYAFEHLHRDPWVPATGPVAMKLSTLLIGTHVQAVTPRDSLAGVLQGIARAAVYLQQQTVLGREVEVAEVEIVEIEEHVALDAAYELRRLMKCDEWSDRFVWKRPVLQTRDGGLCGYRPGASDGVWQRLIIRAEAGGGLKFELIAERARVEATQVYADVASLGSYIKRLADEGAVGRSNEADRASLGCVLYQLLLPQALKGRLRNFDHTVLVVDDESAAYPWELLAPPEDGYAGDKPRPLAVQAGLVRQRVSYEFRALPQGLDGWDALVVGAPSTAGWTDAKGAPLEFVPLKGAADEAVLVQHLLDDDARPWKPRLLLGADISFEKVLTALLERPWRVLHLAGHGVVDQWVKDGDGPTRPAVRKTGMLLSHQHVLSAADVEQMDPVPEFVFINCCYSGQDGREAESLGQRAYPRIAASLAMQFIAMGSKAVVAAGWQVDDRDGQTFAAELYQRLLDGMPFGAAVREARSAVLPRDGATGSNTWGAYQCYGDPEWQLPAEARGGLARSFGGSSRLRDAAQCMSERELAQRILQLAAVAGDKATAALTTQLDHLVESLQGDPLRRDWLLDTRVRVAIGEAYRELGEHVRAVEWLQRGGRSAYSRLELRHIELMANSLARIGGAENHERARRILQALAATDDPRLLLPAARDDDGVPSAASERLCIRGSGLLRQAGEPPPWPVAGKAPKARRKGGADAPAAKKPVEDAAAHAARRQRVLVHAAARAFLAGYRGKLDPRDALDRRAYALSTGLLCSALALRCGVPAKRVDRRLALLPGRWQRHVDELLAEVADAGLSTSFWHHTSTFELLVARHLLAALRHPRLGAEAQQQLKSDLERAARLLQRALVCWPSPAERESVQNRFAMIVRLCSGGPAPSPALARVLATAREALAALEGADIAAAHPRGSPGA